MMHIEFEDEFELDEDDPGSIFFHGTADGAPIQVRVDEGALAVAAPENILENASDQFLDSRARFEAIAETLIRQGRVQGGYLEITAKDVGSAWAEPMKGGVRDGAWFQRTDEDRESRS